MGVRSLLGSGYRAALTAARSTMVRLDQGRRPAFLIIGAQRCGTTTLYDFMCGSPHVVPALHKELDFFTADFQRGRTFYESRFAVLGRSGQKSRHGTALPITGEATPEYLYFPNVPARVAGMYPDIRLIVLLRDPVKRAFSQYLHEKRMGRETLGFAEAIAAEPVRLAGEEARLEHDETNSSEEYRNHGYVARGLYARQLRRWLKHFPREQFLFLRAENLYRDTDCIVRQALRHVGLDDTDWQEPQDYAVDRLGQNSGMDADIKALLREKFQEDQQDCARLLGDDFFADLRRVPENASA